MKLCLNCRALGSEQDQRRKQCQRLGTLRRPGGPGSHGAVTTSMMINRNTGRRSCALAACILLATLAATGCSREPSQTDLLYEQGKQSFASGQYAQARAQLEQAAQLEARRADVFFLLGQVAEKQGDVPAALGFYGETVNLDPDEIEARIRAARLFLDVGDTAQADNILRYVRDFRPNDSRLLTLEVLLRERSGDAEGAIAQAVKLLAADPGAPDVTLLLAELYRRYGQLDKGEQVLRASLVKHPTEPRLRFELAQNLIAQQRPREGEQLLRELMTEQPGVYVYQQRLAELYVSENRLDEAEQRLRDAMRAHPGDERPLLVLADFLATHRSPFVAEQELVNGIFNRPDSFNLRMTLGSIYERMLNLDGAEKVYREAANVVRQVPAQIAARLRAADVLLRAGQAVEADAQIALVLQADPGNLDGLLLRGRMAMARGRPDLAIEDFRTVLQKRSESFDVLSMLVRAYVASGQAELAEAGLRRAIEVQPTHPGARLELIQLLGVANRHDEALEEIDRALEALPNNLAILQARVEMLMAKQEWDQAEAQARQIQDLHPGAIAGYMQLGHIYFTQNRFDKAEETYKMAVAQAPLDHNALQSLVQAIAMNEGLPSAQNYLEGFLKGYVNHPTAYNIIGELYAQRNEHTKAEAAFARAYQLNPTWVQPYVNLAKLYQLRGELEAAVQVFLNGLAIVPDSIQLAMLLALTYEQLGWDQDAIDIYEGVLSKRPTLDPAINSLALLLAKRRGEEEAAKRAVELAERFRQSRSPVYRDTLGWVYYLTGNVEAAQQTLERAVTEFPNLPQLRYHLGRVYASRGRRDEALAQVKQAVDARVPFAGFQDAEQLLGELQAAAQAPAPK